MALASSPGMCEQGDNGSQTVRRSEFVDDLGGSDFFGTPFVHVIETAFDRRLLCHFLPNDPWLLAFLRRVSVRPGMFLGDENVRTLAVFIQEYCQARVDLGMPEFGATESSLLAEFEKWLATKLDDTRDVAWPTLIAADDPGERNVRAFFSRFEEFLRERGDSLSHSADVPWPP
ncbi:hypothetical protein AB3662_29085 [Sorangium cellulosum]|uniref:hypothetical protein n=1 Tax=Sorangium cellulosum TaxID=56 RepID=UPI003D9A6691